MIGVRPTGTEKQKFATRVWPKLTSWSRFDAKFKKAVSQQRTDIATLKKRVQELEKALKAQLRLPSGRGQRAGTAAAQPDGDGAAHRFRAAGMANNRKRLGLSAEDFGLLVGASGQSIYNWEIGKSTPRAKNLAAIAALRGIGKREVARQLEASKQSTA